MTQPKNGRSRLLVLLIALAFFGPLMLASWLYTSGYWQPAGRTNHGALLEPIINLGDTLPSSPIVPLADDRWLMLYANDSECGAGCRDELHRLRQARLMLGNDMSRVGRVFLHGDSPPDRVFLQEQHAGLITISDKGLGELLMNTRPEGLHGGGIYLIDPLGNLVMYFSPDIEPGDIVDDLKHLLELSRIG